MPRKTKKEKLLLDKRKSYPSLQFPESVDIRSGHTGKISPTNGFSFEYTPAAVSPVIKKQVTVQAHDFEAIRKDLRKSLILSIAAMAAEIAFYFYIMK